MKNKEQGITLIAIAITIIVLLILAGISITSLISDNGILKQSQTAADQNKIQEYKQELTLKLLEAQLQTMETKLPTDEGYVDSLRTNVMAKIDGEVYSKEAKTGDALCTATTKTEGYKYTITATEVIYGEIGESDGEGTTGVWTHTSDKVHVTNGKVILEIGSSVKSFPPPGAWFVLGADNGHLLIALKSSESNSFYYFNGVETLNNLCQQKKIDSRYTELPTRSITIEDINRVTGYNPDVIKYHDGEYVDQWKNEVVYTNKNGTIFYKKADNGLYPINETISSYKNFRYPTIGNSGNTITLAKNNSIIVKHTYYKYHPISLNENSISGNAINGSTLAFSKLFGSSNSYWMANRYEETLEGHVYYGIRAFREGFVQGCYSNDTGGTASLPSLKFFYVVELKDEVLISEDGTLSI